MAGHGFIRRILTAVARRDPRDRFKSLVVAGARLVRAVGFRPKSRDGLGILSRQQARIKLLQYAFPKWESRILVIGAQASSVAQAVRAAGYPNCRGHEVTKGHTARIGPEINPVEIVFLVDWSQVMGVPGVHQLLDDVEHLAPARIAASIPTYPDCLVDQDVGAARHGICERPAWWNELFARRGYDPEPPPRERLPGIWPFIFRRREKADQAAPAARISSPHSGSSQIHFIMPDRQNAFRWVTESLSKALNDLAHPAAVIPPQDSPVRQISKASTTIGWSHYWRPYREVAQRETPAYEVFVTNFEMKPRGSLTPWIAELYGRDSVKIAVSQFCREVLLALGVPQDRIHVVPHGYSPEFAVRVVPLPLATRKTFRFLAVVNSYDPYRYGTDILLEAYRKAFRKPDDVCLVIKDYGANTAETESWFDDEGGPEILYYANFLDKADLAAFYASCTAFVAPFRGEGFGMKILDAAVAGLPLILPLYGGPLDYCAPELVEPVAFERRPVGKCLDTDEIEWNEEITWCEPNADDLAERMRRVFKNREIAAEKAARLRSIAVEQFSWDAAARKLLAILK